MNKFQQFKHLHQQDNPLSIGNVWDCQSAWMFEKCGYQAIGTSSAAIANSLGYEDGEAMCFDELTTVVKRIASKMSLPLTVDLEGGYSRDPNQIIKNIVTLYHNGVVGINLEDSVVNKERAILDANDFSKTIKTIKSYLEKNKLDIFLNIRTDPYILGLKKPLNETMTRIKRYEACGADGIFVPCITNEEEIKQVVACTSLPINVMAMPDLPPFDTLKTCGVKRISMGPLLYNKMIKNVEDTVAIIDKDQNFNPLFS